VRLSLASLVLFVSPRALASLTCVLLMGIAGFVPSIATEAQLRTLVERIHPHVTKIEDRRQALVELNSLLRAMELPTIDLDSPDLVVRPAYFKGTFTSELVGFGVSDGRHHFCLPCSVAHNGFRYSIEAM
jgi:hypothetical protein